MFGVFCGGTTPQKTTNSSSDSGENPATVVAAGNTMYARVADPRRFAVASYLTLELCFGVCARYHLPGMLSVFFCPEKSKLDIHTPTRPVLIDPNLGLGSRPGAVSGYPVARYRSVSRVRIPPSAYSYKFVGTFSCAHIGFRKARERELATLNEKSTSSGIPEHYAR